MLFIGSKRPPIIEGKKVRIKVKKSSINKAFSDIGDKTKSVVQTAGQGINQATSAISDEAQKLADQIAQQTQIGKFFENLVEPINKLFNSFGQVKNSLSNF
jgi:uncharacterized protein YoxC